MFETSILFLIFNRPDTTQQVFERIRQIKPTKLYVAADGARKERPGEEEKCRQTRAIINQVDWECEVKTLYRDDNLGCKIAVSSAITWFFDQEEYGIILEDDCLPDLSFFPYCEELLIRYKDDERIGHIGGNNFLGSFKSKLSYDFCNMSHIWGWASWRRVWKNYDVEFMYWRKKSKNRMERKAIFTEKLDEVYFSSFLSDALYKDGKMNTWDVQYLFMLRTQHQLSVYPSVNLVTNIGLMSTEATHTSWKNKRLLIPYESMKFQLIHPEYILPNKSIDKRTIRRNYFSITRLIRYCLGDY